MRSRPYVRPIVERGIGTVLHAGSERIDVAVPLADLEVYVSPLVFIWHSCDSEQAIHQSNEAALLAVKQIRSIFAERPVGRILHVER